MALQKPSSNHLYLVTELCYFIDCDWLSPPWVYQHDYLKAYSSFQYFFFFKRLSSVAKDRNPVPSSLKHEAGVTIVCVCVWTILARGKWSLGLDCKALLGPNAPSVIRTPCRPTLWWTLLIVPRGLPSAPAFSPSSQPSQYKKFPLNSFRKVQEWNLTGSDGSCALP